jgi:hypothetical protein
MTNTDDDRFSTLLTAIFFYQILGRISYKDMSNGLLDVDAVKTGGPARFGLNRAGPVFSKKKFLKQN